MTLAVCISWCFVTQSAPLLENNGSQGGGLSAIDQNFVGTDAAPLLPNLCLNCLQPVHYLRSFRTEQGGQSALTHLALVRTPKGDRRAYVKTYLPAASQGLLNEIIGYTLAFHAGLPQPDGALIKLPNTYLSRLFPNAPLSGTYSTCFLSVDVEDTCKRRVGTAKAFFGKDIQQLAASLKNWPAYSLMVGFDEWIANVDRNTGNLMMVGPDQFWVIDHGHILTGPGWSAEDMNPEQWSKNKLLDLVFDVPKLPLPIKNAILRSAEGFLKVYAKAWPELCFWLPGQSLSDKLMAHHFIWKRAETSAELLKERIQLVA